MPRPALRVFGVDTKGETGLHSIYEAFLRANPVNMLTASLIAGMLDGVPRKSATSSEDAPTWQPPALPAFPSDS